MPFGLSNAPSTFMSHDSDFTSFPGEVCVYFDNILIFSKTQEERILHLTRMQESLRKEKLFVNLNCAFLVPAVHFLGFIVSRNGGQLTLTKLRPSETALRLV